MLLKVDLQVPPKDQLDLPGDVVSVFAEKSCSLSFSGENSHLILQRLSLTFVKWILRFFEFLIELFFMIHKVGEAFLQFWHSFAAFFSFFLHFNFN